MAGGLGGVGAEPGSGGRAASGAGPASGETDAIDLEAITELVLAGHGVPVTARSAAVTELTGWAMHRSRRVQTRTATKNQLLAQLDRCFPGVTLALPDVLGTKIGRLVAAEFADPHRLAALGVTRFVRFAANRGLRVRHSAADRLVAAARNALPAPEAVVARQVLADDLGLLADLDAQILTAEAQMARLLPDTPFAPLTSVPGWGTVRAGNYGAAVGDPGRLCSPICGSRMTAGRGRAERSRRITGTTTAHRPGARWRWCRAQHTIR